VVVLLSLIVVYSCRSINRADAERHVLEARLQDLAERDPLTSLFNRRRFADELDQQLALVDRYGTLVALIMIDLDGLKQINDTYGHRAGDELLLGVARVLNSELRATDTSARLSGDEFAALLPHADLAGAEATAERLVAMMRASSWPIDGENVASTISLGIAITDGTDTEAVALSKPPIAPFTGPRVRAETSTRSPIPTQSRSRR
jgi:diguanylate cyclase (GGDEF)-like protein